jgi:hypothetical protein
MKSPFVMESPFILMTLDPNYMSNLQSFKKYEDSIITKFTKFQKGIVPKKLSESRSYDNDNHFNLTSIKLKKQKLYNKNVGILMVDHKKPFNVRFNLDNNKMH